MAEFWVFSASSARPRLTCSLLPVLADDDVAGFDVAVQDAAAVPSAWPEKDAGRYAGDLPVYGLSRYLKLPFEQVRALRDDSESARQ
jgi:hypothetical protein